MRESSGHWKGKNMREKRIDLSAYGYIYRMRILKILAYRFDVYGNILLQCIVMFAAACFWKALYQSSPAIRGTSIETMLTYTVLSSMMSVLFMTNVEQRVLQSVQRGTVATDMLKPVSLFGLYFFEDLGAVTSLIFQNLLPIFAIGSICISLPKPAGTRELFLFFVSLLMSFMINWLFAACFSMWAFTAINMDPMLQVKKHLLRLLSGSIIPLWFFPDWLRGILNLLPFVYIYQLPLDIYIGKYEKDMLWLRLLTQGGWVLLLFLLFSSLQRKILKRVMVQGG